MDYPGANEGVDGEYELRQTASKIILLQSSEGKNHEVTWDHSRNFENCL